MRCIWIGLEMERIRGSEFDVKNLTFDQLRKAVDYVEDKGGKLRRAYDRLAETVKARNQFIEDLVADRETDRQTIESLEAVVKIHGFSRNEMVAENDDLRFMLDQANERCKRLELSGAVTFSLGVIGWAVVLGILSYWIGS